MVQITERAALAVHKFCSTFPRQLPRLLQKISRRISLPRERTTYGWFTEGFDTADLQEAKALLDELRA
jgi:hypothetical protein